MVAPVAADQRYTQLRHIATAGTITKIEVPFMPDAWVLVPSKSISTPIYFSPTPSISARSAGMPIAGSAPTTISGVRGSKQLFLYNSGSGDVTFRVTASYGLVPNVISAPISLVRPDSVKIQSQLIHEAKNKLNPNSFAHNHVGRYLLILWGMHVSESDTEIQASVTAGGEAGIPLFNIRKTDTTPNRYFVELSGFWVDVEGNANLTINCTMDGVPANDISHYIQVYSFMDGIRAGNDDTDSTTGSATMNLSVLGDNADSRVFAFCLSLDTATAPYINELSGADTWDALHWVASHNSRWALSNVREGKGNNVFQYQVSPTTFPACCAAVEITTT